MTVHFTLNKQLTSIEADAHERFSTVLRTYKHIQSVKNNCIPVCTGSCLVLVNGMPAPSCLLPLFAIENKNIVTLEFFRTTPEYRTIIDTFTAHDMVLCGYCTAAAVFSAYRIMQLPYIPDTGELEKAYIGPLCPCTDANAFLSACKNLARTRKDTVI